MNHKQLLWNSRLL